MRKIDLGCHGIEVILDDNGGGTITSDLHEACPFCEQLDCRYSCDESQAGGFGDNAELESEADATLILNRAIDTLESFILALACAGVDIETPAFLEAVETTVEKTVAVLG